MREYNDIVKDIEKEKDKMISLLKRTEPIELIYILPDIQKIIRSIRKIDRELTKKIDKINKEIGKYG